MPTYICLLRGINVGGNKHIKMADLKGLFESLGFTDVQTLLQSGNVVLTTVETDMTALAPTIEAAIIGHYGFESKIVLRTPEQWRGIVAVHPFTPEQLTEPSKILVTFLRDVPMPVGIEALMALNTDNEQLWMGEHVVYAFFPNGMGRTKLDNNTLERKLKTTGTGRNWNTVQKLLAMVG
jgi:uncharacterized protein (DUF1697 family)